MVDQSLLEQLPIGVFRLIEEASGRLITCNAAFLGAFGYQQIEQINQSGLKGRFVSGVAWKEFLSKLKAEACVSSLEIQLKRSDGSIFWGAINACLTPGPESGEMWVDGTLEDIDERKFEELRSFSQMQILRQASLSLTASLELKEVLDTIAQCAMDMITGLRNCHIFLFQPESGEPLRFGTALWGDGKKKRPFSHPRPKGLTMTVAQSGEPILVSDFRSDPIYAAAPNSWKGSIIGLPLKFGDRVVGVMNVSHTQPGALTEMHLHQLQLLGDHAAIAIENARLYEAAATERRRLSLIYDFGRQLVPSLDADEILERAIRLVCEALGGIFGIAFNFDSSENNLKWRKVYRSMRAYQYSFELPMDAEIGKILLSRFIKSPETIYALDITQDERTASISELCRGMRSMLASPIYHGTQLLGVLCLFHDQAGYFSEDSRELIQTICTQVGAALNNVSRYEQVEQLVKMLEREQDRLKTLMERLPVGVVLINEEYCPVLLNSYGSEILSDFGIVDCSNDLQALGSYSMDELVKHCDAPRPVEVTLDGASPKIYEIEIRLLAAQPQNWLLMLREVTQERHNQTRIQMQDRLATVGQLAAGIAHDFNNIMATILVYSDLLKKALVSDPAGLEQLAIIQQQVKRAASLIRQILDFSRQSILEPAALDLLPFFKEFERLLDRLLPETIRVELKYQVGEYQVHADPTQLQQVFMNLAINARDAMPNGGILSIRIDRLLLNPGDIPPSPYLPQGEWIAITMGDTGVGIQPEVITHIFEPFFSTKPVGEGTGLGLAQAYGIIKQHGGYIDLQSEVGEGTRFAVYLPSLPHKHIEEASVNYFSPLEGHGQTILVVEDDPVTLNAIQDLLEAQHYQVLSASNGKEALKILTEKSGSIDLLVSDMVMPEMGGLALYHQVQDRWPELRTLFVTGHPMGEERQSLLEENRITWLQKPFSVPEFFFTVEEILSTVP